MTPSSISSSPRNSFGRQDCVTETEIGLLADARQLFPGGVLGGNALHDDVRFVFSRGDGSRFWDASGNEYIDYVLGSGTLFVGHAHPVIQKAIVEQVARGTHFFAYLNEQAVQVARRLQQHLPCAQRMRFTTSGSDATFHAMRLARAHTGREKILKFEGAYHGSHDYAQVSTAPKNPANFPTPVPDTAGIPKCVQDLLLVAPYNDVDTLAAILEQHGSEIAAIIVEPIQRIISPQPGFLAAVRELTHKYGIVMILDEVVTGLRYGLGGAQAYFDIAPDLATYGKIIGGGLPMGALAGRAEIMDQADPSNKGGGGYVYQNGTLQGNPLGCAASLATLDILEDHGLYERVFDIAEQLRHGLQSVFNRHKMGVLVFGEGPMWHMLFTDAPPQNWRDILATDTRKLAVFETELIRQGLFILPNNRRFVSIRHTQEDLQLTFDAAERACKAFKAKH